MTEAYAELQQEMESKWPETSFLLKVKPMMSDKSSALVKQKYQR